MHIRRQKFGQDLSWQGKMSINFKDNGPHIRPLSCTWRSHGRGIPALLGPVSKFNFWGSTVWDCLLTEQRPQLTSCRNTAEKGIGTWRFLILMAPISFVSGHLCGAARGSEVDVATCYWLQGSVFEPRWKKDFCFSSSHPSSVTLETTQTPVQ
jgi:hypothetical protein